MYFSHFSFSFFTILAGLPLTACATDPSPKRSAETAVETPSHSAEKSAEATAAQKAAPKESLLVGHQAQPRAEAPAQKAYPILDNAAAIVAAADRTAEDQKKDRLRHPAETLSFIGAKPGWRVVDLGAGSGYTSELLARAIGEEGLLWMHNDPRSIEKYFKKELNARLLRPVMRNVIRADRLPDDAFPDDAVKLDAIVALFTYHDFVNAQVDRQKLNQAAFARLKPGGIYVLGDHAAPADSGLAAGGELHRLEASILRAEVEAAGFVLDEEAFFLRDPTDTLTGISYKQGFVCDRYMLRFKKPNK